MHMAHHRGVTISRPAPTELTAATPTAVAVPHAATKESGQAGPLDDVVILLARAAGVALRQANTQLEPFGLKARHYAALRLAATTGGCPQRQIGAVLGLDPSAVVALVDDLQERKLVRRRTDPDDRRNRLVGLTGPGQRLLERASVAAEQVHQGTVAALPPGERAAFVQALQKIVGV